MLMGVQALPEVVRSLREQGWPDDTPAALIENGTTARQRTVEATLGTAVEAAARARLAAPAVLAAGDVVGMRRRIAWFERRPLSATRVVVLRGESRATELIAALGAGRRGGRPHPRRDLRGPRGLGDPSTQSCRGSAASGGRPSRARTASISFSAACWRAGGTSVR